MLAQLSLNFSMIRKSPRDQIPELPRVVKLLQVTEFVRHDVILYLCGKEKEFVVKIQVALLRATAPAGLLVLYVYLVEIVSVDLVQVCDPFADYLIRLCLVFKVVLVTVPCYRLPFELLEVGDLGKEPVGLLSHKSLGHSFLEIEGSGHNDRSITIHCKSHPACPLAFAKRVTNFSIL